MSAPLPPPDFFHRPLTELRLAAGTNLHRFHDAAYAPVFFDRSQMGRLNAPDGAFGVFYAAATVVGAFAETFLRQPGRTLLAPDLIAWKTYAVLRLRRDLRLLQLYGVGLARAGATAEVTHGGLPYDTPQRWSAAIFAHPARYDGIAYTARHEDGEICLALFDRAIDAIEEAERVANLQTGWFFDLLDRYGVGLAPG